MLVILSGVAGAGKNTIQKELIKRMENVIAIPSYTDREVRPGDVPGETYNFVSTEEFERMIKDGELYEYSVHHEHYYGTSRKLMNEKIKEADCIVVGGASGLSSAGGGDFYYEDTPSFRRFFG